MLGLNYIYTIGKKKNIIPQKYMLFELKGIYNEIL